MEYNLHTHSFYCGHGKGTIQEFADEAARLGLGMLGFSEHCPYPDDLLHESRMLYSRMADYERDVRKAAETSPLQILLGYECDFWPGRDDYMKDVKDRVDYLCFGIHLIPGYDCDRLNVFSSDLNDPRNLALYAKACIRALESGIFEFAAHPDVFMYGKDEWDQDAIAVSKDIIQAAIGTGTPIEVNLNGIVKAHRENLAEYRYPRRRFWEMASEMGAPCIMNSDAHVTKHLSSTRAEGLSFAGSLNLKMVEPIFKDGRLSFTG